VQHPYRSFPARQFWAKAVSTSYDASTIGDYPVPLIRPKDKVVTAGSCFAANLIPFLEKAGFRYLKTDYTHPLFQRIPQENLSYGKFSAGYGNIYTVRQLYQLLLRTLGEFKPLEDRWAVGCRYLDPFRPALAYAARSDREFDALTASYLRAVKRAFTECDAFVFTLGLTEAWVSTLDGAVFPACPGTISGEYDPERHSFVNFTVDDVRGDLRKFILRLRELNPNVRIILTVSPVPLVATAEPKHVLSSTTYSKSVLRVAAEMAAREFEDVHYFPAYEIVTGPQAPEDVFEPDRRNVSKHAVEMVMGAFLSACAVPGSLQTTGAVAPSLASGAEQLSARLADLECEEAAQAL
jgi:hypothetical protein